VTLDLYKGNISVAKRSSPNSLYDDQIATMEGGGSYNQDDAEGFLRIQGLPGRVQARILGQYGPACRAGHIFRSAPLRQKDSAQPRAIRLLTPYNASN